MLINWSVLLANENNCKASPVAMCDSTQIMEALFGAAMNTLAGPIHCMPVLNGIGHCNENVEKYMSKWRTALFQGEEDDE